MTLKVLLDTDIGTDIDDAVCLAYLLANPDCDLLGITTVSGEADQRAMMASVLCKIAGKDIPIYPGVEVPLIIPQRQTHAQQAAALPRWEHRQQFPKGEAVEFLRHTIRQHPGEITLLTIGPLTNIALLFASDPEIPALLKGLVLMCGMFTDRKRGFRQPEWNALLDPHATTMVYRANPPLHRSIGLDVTTQVTMPANEVRNRFTAPLLRPVLDFAEIWFKERPVITFHDPLAAVTLFDESVCTYEKGSVEIELAAGNNQGCTLWTSGDESPRHEVAMTVDANRFFERYFGVFK